MPRATPTGRDAPADFNLIPATNHLWNLCEEQQVEPAEQHGTIDDVLRQLTVLGFNISEARAVRTPKSRADSFFINCSRNS